VTRPIEDLDLSVNINSAVFTYRRVDHTFSSYFNGFFLGAYAAQASYVNDVIDWSTSDNLYVNRFHEFSPLAPTHYHKISAYNKISTPTEIETMYNQIIQDVDKNPTYTFQVTFKHDFIMPDEVKAFNFNDVRINLQGSYTTLIPHDGHAGQDGYDLTKLFDNDTVTPSYVWWDVKNTGVAINIGDQLFSVTIPSLPGDNLIDRQVNYFEITWEEQRRSAGLLILRNGEVVYDDGTIIDGYIW
jgi:hypothetical protein